MLRLRPGWTVFLGLAAVGFAALVIVVAWIVANRDGVEPWHRVLVVTGIAVFFLLVLIAPSGVSAIRALRGIPWLAITPDGLHLGMPGRHPFVPWDDIRWIEPRAMRTEGVVDQTLIVHLRGDPGAWTARLPFWWRVGARVTRLIYGSPLVLSTAPLDRPFHEIVAALNRHRPGLTHP